MLRFDSTFVKIKLLVSFHPYNLLKIMKIFKNFQLTNCSIMFKISKKSYISLIIYKIIKGDCSLFLFFVIFFVNQVHQVKEQSFVSIKSETVNEQKGIRNYINPQLVFVIRE